MNKKDLWVGLNERARKGLTPRNYKSGTLGQRIAESGVDAGELTASRSKTELKKVWIPGVEIFSRATHPQRHRGSFCELARQSEGIPRKVQALATELVSGAIVRHHRKGISYPS